MSQPIYSTRFALAALTSSGAHDLYTVPDGYLAVLRCVDMVFNGTVGSSGALRIAGILVTLAGPTTEIDQAFTWRGRQVMLEGELLDASLFLESGVTAWVTASGYLFSLP